MKVRILYNPNSESARPVEEFAHEFKRIHGRETELVSTETREGAEISRLYDIVQTPCIMAVEDDGRMAQLWVGETLPLMSEVASYVAGF